MRKWAEPHCRVPSSQYNGNRRREIVWSGADIISYCLRRPHTRASMSNPLPLIRCFAWDARGHTHEQKQGQEGGVCTEGSWQRLLLQQRWMGRLQTTFIHNGIWQQSTSFPRFLGDKDKKNCIKILGEILENADKESKARKSGWSVAETNINKTKPNIKYIPDVLPQDLSRQSKTVQTHSAGREPETSEQTPFTWSHLFFVPTSFFEARTSEQAKEGKPDNEDKDCY